MNRHGTERKPIRYGEMEGKSGEEAVERGGVLYQYVRRPPFPAAWVGSGAYKPAERTVITLWLLT